MAANSGHHVMFSKMQLHIVMLDPLSAAEARSNSLCQPRRRRRPSSAAKSSPSPPIPDALRKASKSSLPSPLRPARGRNFLASYASRSSAHPRYAYIDACIDSLSFPPRPTRGSSQEDRLCSSKQQPQARALLKGKVAFQVGHLELHDGEKEP